MKTRFNFLWSTLFGTYFLDVPPLYLGAVLLEKTAFNLKQAIIRTNLPY